MKTIKITFIIICLGILISILTLFVFKINPKVFLYGVTIANEKPKIQKRALLSGKYQLDYDKWFSDNFPLRGYFVKAYDQILYQFGNPVNGVQEGKNGDLHGEMWMNSYLMPNIEPEILENYFKSVKYVNKQLLLRNKKLVYVISPNKAEVNNDTLPLKYKWMERVVKNKAKERKKVNNFLKKENIISVDTTNIMISLKEGGILPFCRTGIHWNQIAASKALIAVINKMKQNKINVGNIYISNKTVSDYPTFDEIDYKQLMNVYYSEEYGPYPKVTLNIDDKEQREIGVFAMTTSYTNMIVELFAEYGMPFQKFKRLYYNQSSSHLYYDDNNKLKFEKWLSGVQMDEVNYREILDNYDVIVVEHNAGEIPQTHIEFIQNFADYLHKNSN